MSKSQLCQKGTMNKYLQKKLNNFFLNKVMNFKYKVTKSTSLQIINCAINKFLTLEVSSIETHT